MTVKKVLVSAVFVLSVAFGQKTYRMDLISPTNGAGAASSTGKPKAFQVLMIETEKNKDTKIMSFSSMVSDGMSSSARKGDEDGSKKLIEGSSIEVKLTEKSNSFEFVLHGIVLSKGKELYNKVQTNIISK